MKRILVVLMFASIVFTAETFAGGIVTNANQSAAYIRMPAQDATLSIDGVYYNPAGLVFLPDGLHISINNQYITQTRKISSTFPNMNRTEFKGGVVAPIFPGIYVAYKKDKAAFSLGFNPIGGGGSAKFDNGLPSFEQQVAVLPGALTAAGITTTQYSFQSEFEGRSLMYGIQVNGSYAINEMISFSLGIRCIIAKNFYDGYMRNIQINPNKTGFGAAYDGTNMVSAPQFFTDAAAVLTSLSTGATSLATGLAAVPAATPVSALPAGTQTQLATILGAANISTTGMNVGTAIASLNGVAPAFAAQSTTMSGYAAMTADKEADVTQSGFGYSPIIGIDLKLSDKLNIGFRYEQRAKIEAKNKTTKDDVHLWPDGVNNPNDMPTTISLGAQYKATDKLKLAGGVHYYFDKGAEYGKVKSRTATGVPTFYDNKDVIDNNFLEIALGGEYAVSDKLLVSAGYLRTQSGVNELYQSDLSHSLSTNTLGAGGKYIINDKVGVNVGIMYSNYLKETKPFTTPLNYEETYKRYALVFALGVDLKF